YDVTNQLTADGTHTFSYDANGNRTAAGYRTGAGNRLLSDGVWTYQYDPEGNRVKKTKGAQQETWTYGYDHDNHLVCAEQRATDGGELLLPVEYQYDAFGNRVERSVWSADTGQTAVERYAYDDQDVWADLDANNQVQVRYLRGDAVDQLFARLGSNGSEAWY